MKEGYNWVRKATSRKLWLAIALFVSGVLTATGHKEMAETVAGLIMQGAAVVAYIIGEGLTDAASAKVNSGGIQLEQEVEIEEEGEVCSIQTVC